MGLEDNYSTDFASKLKQWHHAVDGQPCYMSVKRIARNVNEMLPIPKNYGFDGCVQKNELILATLIKHGIDPKAIRRVSLMPPIFNDAAFDEMTRVRAGGGDPDIPLFIVPDRATFPLKRNREKELGITDRATKNIAEGVQCNLFPPVERDGITFCYPNASRNFIELREGEGKPKYFSFKPQYSIGHAGLAIREDAGEGKTKWKIIDPVAMVVNDLDNWKTRFGVDAWKGKYGTYIEPTILTSTIDGGRFDFDTEFMSEDNKKHYAQCKKMGYCEGDELMGAYFANTDPANKSYPSHWSRNTTLRSPLGSDDFTITGDKNEKRLASIA